MMEPPARLIPMTESFGTLATTLIAILLSAALGLLIAVNVWYIQRRRRTPAEKWREEQKRLRTTGDW
jgi:hypothetical protein